MFFGSAEQENFFLTVWHTARQITEESNEHQYAIWQHASHCLSGGRALIAGNRELFDNERFDYYQFSDDVEFLENIAMIKAQEFLS